MLNSHALAPRLANHAVVAIAADLCQSRVRIGLSVARMRSTASQDFAIAAKARAVQAVDSVRSFAVLSRLLKIHALAPRSANHAVVAIAADPCQFRVPIGLSVARTPLTVSQDFAIAARVQAVQAADRVRSLAVLSPLLKTHVLAPRLANHAAVAIAARFAGESDSTALQMQRLRLDDGTPLQVHVGPSGL